MRLGGVVHAARALWACGASYAIAAICPKYLVRDVEEYVLRHGCLDFIWLADVDGAPNVVVIADARETSFQGYEDLLRDSRRVVISEPQAALESYATVLIFPGHFDLGTVATLLDENAIIDLDVAYNVSDLSALEPYRGRLRTIMISTSSTLFAREGADDLVNLLTQSKQLGASWFLLKENRGGSRLFDLATDTVARIPAQLGNTVNSVGVGDAYASVMASRCAEHGALEAAWRGAQVATRYAQTTYVDDLKRDVQRDAQLNLSTLQTLGGTSLPWHDRSALSIYLAAPDFSYEHKPEVDQVVSALRYHNFNLRRPVQEIGELDLDASFQRRSEAFAKDTDLMKTCAAVFAVPIGRDPGTLFEIGMAIAGQMPVITFDPRSENNNTMIVAGSTVYSADLDQCLNGLFYVLGNFRPT